jgi:hypothetical protein
MKLADSDFAGHGLQCKPHRFRNFHGQNQPDHPLAWRAEVLLDPTELATDLADGLVICPTLQFEDNDIAVGCAKQHVDFTNDTRPVPAE